MSAPTDPPKKVDASHPCFDPDGPPDHDWKYHGDSDYAGPFGHWECERCGEFDNERGPPDYSDDDL